MQLIGHVLELIGYVGLLIGWGWIVVQGFKKGFLWGLWCVMPVGALALIVRDRDATRRPLWIGVAGVAILLVGAIVGGSGAAGGPARDAEAAMLRETFATAPASWSFATSRSEASQRFNAPGVAVTLPGGETTTAAYWYRQRQFGDATVAVTVVLQSAGEPGTSYGGLTFRALSDRDAYRFFIDGAGYYCLTLRKDGTRTPLIDWTPSPALRRGVGAENRLQVVTRGPQITLIANGTTLATVSDRTFPLGYFALQMQSGDHSAQATTFAFRDLVVDTRLSAPLTR